LAVRLPWGVAFFVGLLFLPRRSSVSWRSPSRSPRSPRRSSVSWRPPHVGPPGSLDEANVTGENPERQNSITPAITFKLPKRHCVFGPFQCWPGRSQVFLRGQKSGCEEDALLLVSALVTRGEEHFVRSKICFLDPPPAPPFSQCWVCTSSSFGSRNYFGHWRHTPLLNIEGTGARGAATQVRFGKLNVIGVVCFTAC